MFLDGLEDAYDKGRLMGTFAEDCAEAFQFTRERSRTTTRSPRCRTRWPRSKAAPSTPRLRPPGNVPHGGGDDRITVDEQPAKARPEKIPHLKPAFREGGTVTAANSSSISDGAAALFWPASVQPKA
jgi:acetyl-CoA C-acetyltransferase